MTNDPQFGTPASREEKLAQALRANLRRRKQQIRGRSESEQTEQIVYPANQDQESS